MCRLTRGKELGGEKKSFRGREKRHDCNFDTHASHVPVLGLAQTWWVASKKNGRRGHFVGNDSSYVPGQEIPHPIDPSHLEKCIAQTEN